MLVSGACVPHRTITVSRTCVVTRTYSTFGDRAFSAAGPGLWNSLPSHLKDAGLDWIVQCFTCPPTQYRLYGRRFLQVKRPNQQYQSTEGKSTKDADLSYNEFRWSLKTFLFEQWGYGAVWTLLTAPTRNIRTYLLYLRLDFSIRALLWYGPQPGVGNSWTACQRQVFKTRTMIGQRGQRRITDVSRVIKHQSP